MCKHVRQNKLEQVCQLQNLADQLQEVRPQKRKVRFLHDNARSHVATKTRQKLLELGWDVLPHAAHSPDLSPTDFHLFRALSNVLQDKKFNTQDEINTFLNDYFNSLPPSFYADGINSLPDRWQKVIDCDGDYCT
ncbi:unnamed protein product [Euphydryas editha]|uniref:Transposase n=1 Tax=Euphydryas editha TaxID=104508 RepID=A0AAU9UQV7_EUPED|nr:unnamed protein product [Euphydryas editha]